MHCPFGEVGNPRCDPIRVQADSQHIRRRRQQNCRHSLGQHIQGSVVGGDEVPPAVYDQRWERLVTPHDLVKGASYRCHLIGSERRLPVHRRISSGQQQRVLLAQWDLELGSEVHHELSARSGATGLDKAQVPGRHIRRDRQVELAEPTALPPPAQQPTDSRCLSCRGHRRED
jgi:hypothetical protein